MWWRHRFQPILDEINTVLAGHYGFPAAELAFILNYDIKYRPGNRASLALPLTALFLGRWGFLTCHDPQI